MVGRASAALALLALFATVSATVQVESLNGRRLLGSCSIGGMAFSSCEQVKGGTVGFSASSSILTVGFIGGNATGWAGWTVGKPHRGSSAVFNIKGAVSTRTMNGHMPFRITEPSTVEFSDVRAGTEGYQLWATFSLPLESPNFEWAFAYGPYFSGLMRHAGKPKVYQFES